MGSMGSALLYGSILRTGISSVGFMGALGLGAVQGSWRAIYKVSALMQVANQNCTVLYYSSLQLFCVIPLSRTNAWIWAKGRQGDS